MINIKRKLEENLEEPFSLAILVYDITKRESFNYIDTLLNTLNSYKELKNIIFILVGNKTDLKDKREIQTEEGKQK